jgi:transitional endoplasmic reticulum ATPase
MGVTLNDVAQVKVAEIVHMGEKMILPVGMSMDDAIALLQRRKKYLEEEVAITEVFDVFPYDGAVGLRTVLTRRYGWAAGERIPSFFGSKPPQMLSVEIGPGETIHVPWGRFSLPKVTGYIETGVNRKDGRLVFQLTAVVLRKDEETLKDLFVELRKELRENSIYRGKAVKIRFRRDDGAKIDMPEPKFMATAHIKRDSLIFSDAVSEAVETSLFTPIERCADCLSNGIPVKRGILLGGPFGTGKTLAAQVASKIAVDCGITYVYVARADELADGIEFARQYQSPACVVFCEDIDRAMSGERTAEMDDILNIIDGIDTKNANLIVVMTTNALDAINPALLRPGRLDAVIEVTSPDPAAVERLLRLYGKEAISADTDLGEAAKKLAGNIPAVIAEVVKRAKLNQLRLQAPGTHVRELSETALVNAAETMKRQMDILRRATEPKEEAVTLDTVMRGTVRAAINGHGEKIDETHKTVKSINERV